MWFNAISTLAGYLMPNPVYTEFFKGIVCW